MQADPALTTLPDLLRTRASAEPDRPFVRFKERAMTYGEFDARTDQLAAGLADLGVTDGDVVSVFLPNCLEFLEAWWAILKAGGVLGPVNPAYVGPEAAYVIEHSRAVAVVTDERGVGVLEPVRGELGGVAPRDLHRRLRRRRPVAGGGRAAWRRQARCRRRHAGSTTSPRSSTRRARPASRRARC